MPLLDAIAGPAIGAVGEMFSSKTAAKAAKEASKIQAKSFDKALDFEKDQYRNEQARLQPFRDVGSQAMNQIGQRFGFSAPPAAPQTQWGFGGGGMVKIRHPRTGEIRDVPAAQAEMLKQRGGQVVG